MTAPESSSNDPNQQQHQQTPYSQGPQDYAQQPHAQHYAGHSFASQGYVPPPPPPPMGVQQGMDPHAIAAIVKAASRRSPWGTIIIVALFLLGGFMMMSVLGTMMAPTEIGIQEEIETRGDIKEKIAVINFSGIVLDAPGGLLGLGENPVQTFDDGFDRVERDKNVQGILLTLDTPGGGITASDLLAHRIDTFRDRMAAEGRNVPIVVLMKDLCASGGYYIACKADWIIAHPTTITGSIGVIMTQYNIAGLMEKLGIEDTTVTSVDNKATGSMTSPRGPFDEDYFRQLITPMHERFVDVVYEGRQAALQTRIDDRPFSAISRAEIASLADGSVYGAEQALELKLVDEIGYHQEAIDRISALASLADPTVVNYTPAPVTISPTGVTIPAENLRETRGPTTDVTQLRSIHDLMVAAGPRIWVIWLGG